VEKMKKRYKTDMDSFDFPRTPFASRAGRVPAAR
jgi:hypothetical protein